MKGLIAENERLLQEALGKYPTNLSVSALANTLFAKWGVTGQVELLAGIIDYCQVILRNSLDDPMRYSAIQILVYAYSAKGDKEKATKMAKRIPSYLNQEMLMASVLDGEEKLRQIQQNIMSWVGLIGLALDTLHFTSRRKGDYLDSLHLLELKETLFQTCRQRG